MVAVNITRKDSCDCENARVLIIRPPTALDRQSRCTVRRSERPCKLGQSRATPQCTNSVK